MRIRTFLLATPFLLLGDPAAAQTAAQLEALESGKTAGSSAVQGIFDGISHDQGAGVIRNYSTTPPAQSSYWGGDHTAINPINASGTAKVTACGTDGTSATAEDTQHCEAVNSIVKTRADKPAGLVTPSDELLIKGRAITADPEAIAGAIDGSYSECSTATTTQEPSFSLQTCEDWSLSGTETCSLDRVLDLDLDYLYRCKESLSLIRSSTCSYGRVIQADTEHSYQCSITTPLETKKCRRGHSADVGIEVKSSSYSVDHGSSVPKYSSRTFNTTMTINGTPNAFILHRYQVDNYGQVWINGQLVYQNPLSGAGWPRDLRNASVVYSNGYKLRVGGTNYSFWDDGCNSGCSGVYPRKDITSYLREGANTITLVCVNARSIGPCAVTITGSVNELVFLGSIVNNGCAALQERAK